MDNWPTMKVEFPNMAWRGCKSSSGSPSPVDGAWVPWVESRIVFDAHDMPRNIYAHHPDLCADCIASLMRQMADSVAKSSNDQAQRLAANNPKA